MIDKVELSVSVGDGIIDVKNSIIRIIRVLAKYYWSARRVIASYSDDTQTSTLYPKTNRAHISGRDRQVSVPSTQLVILTLFLQTFLMFWDFFVCLFLLPSAIFYLRICKLVVAFRRKMFI